MSSHDLRYARMSGLQRREKDLEAEVADLEAEVKRASGHDGLP